MCLWIVGLDYTYKLWDIVPGTLLCAPGRDNLDKTLINDEPAVHPQINGLEVVRRRINIEINVNPIILFTTICLMLSMLERVYINSVK